jgi:hypothetical protein
LPIHDDEAYVVVASNWGKDSHTGWFYNLMHQNNADLLESHDNLLLA